jgi:hypothetical protein
MKVISNHHSHPFVYRLDVPDEILADQFDHLDPDEMDGFLRYRGCWYHLSDFLRMDDPYWQGIATDSYFSGVVIRVSSDGETYQIGLAFSSNSENVDPNKMWKGARHD